MADLLVERGLRSWRFKVSAGNTHVGGSEDDGRSCDAAVDPGASDGTRRQGGGHVTENILLCFKPGVERFEDGGDGDGGRGGGMGGNRLVVALVEHAERTQVLRDDETAFGGLADGSGGFLATGNALDFIREHPVHRPLCAFELAFGGLVVAGHKIAAWADHQQWV
jgi:hypothetical protein